MKLQVIFLVLLLSSVAFAQSDDIGQTLFRDVLQMRDYPGGSFSGRTITENLIMFFLVPTVFIILVVYMMVGRILPGEYTKLRLLLGVTSYLFIVAGGYYGVFALLAGPYFIFLIFIMGLLYFLLGHFRGGEGPGGTRYGGGGRHGGGTATTEGDVGELAALKLNELKGAVLAAKTSMRSMKGNTYGLQGMVAANSEIGRLMAELNSLKSQFRYNPGAQASYKFKIHKLHLNEGQILKDAEHYLGSGK